MQHAARVAMGVELRPILKEMESPSNPKVAVVVTGAGLRASAKVLGRLPPDPTMTRAARTVVTPGVIE